MLWVPYQTPSPITLRASAQSQLQMVWVRGVQLGLLFGASMSHFRNHCLLCTNGSVNSAAAFLLQVTTVRNSKPRGTWALDVFAVYILGGLSCSLMLCLRPNLDDRAHVVFKAVVYWSIGMVGVWFGMRGWSALRRR